MRALFLFLIFTICLPAFGQTTFLLSPETPSTPLMRGVENQETARFTSDSSTGGNWTKVNIQFNKVVPGNPWTVQNINTFISAVRIMDGAGNVIVSDFIPSTCVGATITSTLWSCEVVTNFTVPPGESREWRVFADIPLTSGLTFIRQGFIPTLTPNVQLTGGGLATIPNMLVQGQLRQVQSPPPQPSMTLSGNSPTGNISRGATNVIASQFLVIVGPGSGNVTFTAFRIVVEKTGGVSWTLANINSDFSQLGVFDSVGNVPVPKFNPSTCADVVVMPNHFECTVPVTYSLPVATTRNFDVIFNVGISGGASTLRVGFIPTLSPNTTLPGGGSFTFPAASVLGLTRAIVSPPPPSQPTMTLSASSPTGELLRGVNDQVLTQAIVTMSAGVGSATINSVTFMVNGVGTSWTPGNINQDFVQIEISDDLAGTVVAQFSPASCVQVVLTLTTWQCTLATSYTMNAGEVRTWNIIIDVPPGATATSLRGSFEVGNGNVSLSAGGATSLPTARILGGVRLLTSAPPPDPIFSNGFEGN